MDIIIPPKEPLAPDADPFPYTTGGQSVVGDSVEGDGAITEGSIEGDSVAGGVNELGLSLGARVGVSGSIADGAVVSGTIAEGAVVSSPGEAGQMNLLGSPRLLCKV